MPPTARKHGGDYIIELCFTPGLWPQISYPRTAMQVDSQHPYSFPAPLTDLADIFNPDAFADDLANAIVNAPNSPPTASSSRGSSPYLSSIQTPPQSHAFPDYTPSSFFGLDDDLQTKQYDSMMNIPNNPYEFFSVFEGVGMGIDGGMGMEMTTDMPGINTGIVGEAMGIDPQLVGTPSAHSDIDEEEEDVEHDGDVSASPSSSGSPPATTEAAHNVRSAKRKERELETEEEREKLTLVIQPVKAGGHGKARKGTVQSGGIMKKTPSPHPFTASLGKENTYTSTTSSSFVASPTYTPPSAFQPTNIYDNLQSQEKKRDGKEDEDDELPQDWRPSPEVLAKMTSKEKRQLRNKISARNFRVRRKGVYHHRFYIIIVLFKFSIAKNTFQPLRATLRSAIDSSRPSVPSSVQLNPRTWLCDKRLLRSNARSLRVVYRQPLPTALLSILYSIFPRLPRFPRRVLPPRFKLRPRPKHSHSPRLCSRQIPRKTQPRMEGFGVASGSAWVWEASRLSIALCYLKCLSWICLPTNSVRVHLLFRRTASGKRMLILCLMISWGRRSCQRKRKSGRKNERGYRIIWPSRVSRMPTLLQ